MGSLISSWTEFRSSVRVLRLKSFESYCTELCLFSDYCWQVFLHLTTVFIFVFLISVKLALGGAVSYVDEVRVQSCFWHETNSTETEVVSTEENTF